MNRQYDYNISACNNLRNGWLLAGLAALLAGCLGSPAVAQTIELRNKNLVVRFADSPAGPRLASIEHRASGEVYRLQGVEEAALVIVPLEDVHNPAYQTKYVMQNGFGFCEAAVDETRHRATFHFRHELLDVTITYELKGDVLRKAVTCTGGKAGAYVASITLWLLRPVDRPPVWPKNGSLGQPAVLFGEQSGCFVTLEWPRAKFASLGGDVRLACHPGYELGPGQLREIAAGSIGLFNRPDMKAARQAFFRHVADRVRPTIPLPIKFTTWGPWLGQARADRILETIDDMQYVGVDLLHFDAGWQQPDHPYSLRLPKVRGASDKAWDREMTQPERLPDGLLPIVRAANERGMKVSLWFDACGNVFVYEGEKWAVRDRDGEPVISRTWEGRIKEAPKQSLASAYGDRLQEFVCEAIDRYDLGGMLFDNNSYAPDFAADRRSLANGWNAIDVQLRQIMEIFDEADRRRPGIYRFYCVGHAWPWSLLHATHIHAGDPGTTPQMREAMATDYPARALAFERRLAWQRLYDNFVPPWGIKGDIAGWSTQQGSPIPINLDHTEELIPAGEGWTQNMFTCFATTAVRDVRFSFRQMPDFDRDVLKEWLAWDREHTQFVLNCRPLFPPSRQPNEGISGYSHVGDGKGVLYLFNSSFEAAEVEVTLDEDAGFRPDDNGLSAFLVYPMRAPLGSGKVSYGDTLRVPIFGKDCLVIEVGLDAPDSLASYDDYRRTAGRVKRSFDALFLTPVGEILKAASAGDLQIEVGKTPQDCRLAGQIVEAIGVGTGRRLTLDDSSAPGRCRLIVGTYDGLKDHPDVGNRFREMLYSRYLAWDGQLISAPLAASNPGSEPPTYCLLAPRPEQLARLAINLMEAVTSNAEVIAEDKPSSSTAAEQTFSVNIPRGRTALRFRPLMRVTGHVTIPNDIDRYRFRVEAERNGERTVIWQEDIPPFLALGGGRWWDDRAIPTSSLAAGEVTFHLTVAPTNGRGHPQVQVGFDRVALLRLVPPTDAAVLE